MSLRVLSIRGREICISLSDRFADASYHISVTSLGSSHFVFLDLSLLRWVRDVLQEALQKGWKLGKELARQSGSRSLSIGSFFNNDSHFLRISELCKDGKRDESWLVDCGSEIQVKENLKRNWYFRGRALEVCRWHPDAGRDSKGNSSGGAWILAFRIPVHLRSLSTFKAVGEACSGFIDCQETSFAAVRIKVKTGMEVSSSICLCLSQSSFVIPIVSEPLLGLGDRKGKEVAVQPRCRRLGVEETPPKDWPPAPTRVSEVGETSKQGAARVGVMGQSALGLVSVGMQAHVVSKELGIKTTKGQANPSLESYPCSFSSGPDCVRLPELDLLVEVAARPFLSNLESCMEPRREAALDKALAAGCWASNASETSPIPVSRASEPSCWLVRAWTQKETTTSLLPSFFASGRELDSSSESGTEGSCSDINSIGSEEVVVEDVEDDSSSPCPIDSVVVKGKHMTSILDLHLQGSAVAAGDRIEEVAREVMLRRSASVPRTKKESELRRLKWTLAEPDSRGSTRQSRYDSQSIHSNDS
ncbi:hypothetical protein LINPERHAP2_LOCUS8515 [Linum perenne]